MKEYNQWELRFLSILVPKYIWIGLVAYSNNCKMDRAFFAGSKKPNDPDDPLFPDISDKHYSKQTEWDTMWDLFHKINK